MTLRFRLTLVSIIVLSVVLASFGLGVYILLNKTLHENLDREMLRYANNVASDLDTNEIPTDYLGRPDFILHFISSTGLVRGVAPWGVVLIEADAPMLSVATQQTRGYFADRVVQGIRFRVLVAPMVGSQVRGAIIVGAPLASIDQTLRRLRLLLTWAGVVGLGIAFVLAWQAARTALRPVEEVAGAASEIGRTGDLSRRVDPGGEDELGRLTTAFNGMLDRLENAHRELERTVEGQRRFLADASHELRTPLTTMRGNLEVIRSSTSMTPEDLADALKDSIEEAERMTSLVEDLLALARADARAPRPSEDVQLAAVTREAVALAAGADEAAGGDGPDVELSVDDSVVVRGSPEMLRRLVTNLVENAIKYTPGGGRVSVGVYRDNGFAVVRVADTGIGMSEDELAHAFDRFWRSDRSRGERGTGLGLAIAKSVAEEHDGAIAAESVPGAGTVMTVRLPIATGGGQGEIATGL